MEVLIGCERSGIVAAAFNARGHDAWSCDLVPTDHPFHKKHLVCDVREALRSRQWDLFIAFPDCTFVCGSGIHWNARRPERAELTRKAIAFAREIDSADVPMVAWENPVGILSTEIRKPEQIIQPYLFGHDASKATCLWLKNLPPLKPTFRFPGRWVFHGGKWVERWGNQTDSGQNRLAPGEGRAMERATTYFGVGEAMAEQWGYTAAEVRATA